jgi:secreted PhoX family phosphatase
MGDDEVNQHVYKFVSADDRHSMHKRRKSPLDEGTLYVARFNADGSGEWLPLVHGNGPLTAANGFADQGDVLVKTRLAAKALGATPMDRPEWTSVDPNTGLVYVTLTNNTSAAKPEHPANPRIPNRWGHILRWKERRGDHTSTRFEWDIFLLAGQGRSSGDGSTVDDEDAFGSPDGLWVDPDGRVWIQTDSTGPAHDVRQHPAPRRVPRQQLAAERRHQHATTGDGRDHEGRRRRDRHVAAVGGSKAMNAGGGVAARLRWRRRRRRTR